MIRSLIAIFWGSTVRVPVLLALLVVVVCTGCAAATPEVVGAYATSVPEASTDEVATPADETSGPTAEAYDSLEELRLALEESGFPCPTLADEGLLQQATESGACGGTKAGTQVFAIYDSREDRDTMLEFQMITAEVVQSGATGPGAESFEIFPILVGPNWLSMAFPMAANVSTLDAAQAAIGGVVWIAPAPFPGWLSDFG